MWKFLYESVEGTSHRETGGICQDASFVTSFPQPSGDALVVICSDGAGSAKESHVGSRLACEIATSQAVQFLESGESVAGLSPATVHEWIARVHDGLLVEAATRKIVARELACTLLIAVLDHSGAVFAQIGDGAIVVLEEGKYRPVFWPQTGEYQNTTFFVTEGNFAQNIQTEIRARSIEEIAVFSDGLQMLALNYSQKNAHQAFFTPMFASLRHTADHQELILPFREFLNSSPINERTDDDKTLILATRVQASANAGV